MKTAIKKIFSAARPLPDDVKHAVSSFAFAVFIMSVLLGALGAVTLPQKEELPVSEPCGFEPYIEPLQGITPVSALLECSVSEESELSLLARAAEMAFGSESYTARVAFCAVILNRAENDMFPQSIAAVIKSAGLYPESFDSEISERTMHAARAAMLGVDPTMGALYIMSTEDASYTEYESRTSAIYGSYAFIK